MKAVKAPHTCLDVPGEVRINGDRSPWVISPILLNGIDLLLPWRSASFFFKRMSPSMFICTSQYSKLFLLRTTFFRSAGIFPFFFGGSVARWEKKSGGKISTRWGCFLLKAEQDSLRGQQISNLQSGPKNKL